MVTVALIEFQICWLNFFLSIRFMWYSAFNNPLLVKRYSIGELDMNYFQLNIYSNIFAYFIAQFEYVSMVLWLWSLYVYASARGAHSKRGKRMLTAARCTCELKSGRNEFSFWNDGLKWELKLCTLMKTASNQSGQTHTNTHREKRMKKTEMWSIIAIDVQFTAFVVHHNTQRTTMVECKLFL